MNLLEQTALILGLTCLSIGSWTIYRDFRNRISIFFCLLCSLIAIWSISFVSHLALGGRLSHDIHEFCNVWLAPTVILLLSKVFFKKPNRFTRNLQLVSSIGAVFLGAIISLSISRTPLIENLIAFWPSFILIEYVYIVYIDLTTKGQINGEYLSPSKKFIFFLGLGLSLAFCSFDHIPFWGYTIPALGNLLLTVYLVFASQIILPQRMLRIEAILSRFFAILILALMITGFFALLYNYISGTFPLFLLNSFLISFAVLMLWNPLVTLFRYLARELGRSGNESRNQKLLELRDAIAVETDLDDLQALVSQAFQVWLPDAEVTLEFGESDLKIPAQVMDYFHFQTEHKITPILHREILREEQSQVLSNERRMVLGRLLRFLDNHKSDLIFPVLYSKRVVGLILLSIKVPDDEWNLSVGPYSKLEGLIQELGPTLVRLVQIKEAKERDRLVLMGEMAAGLAHEIRNPLGAIRGAADLIAEEGGPWGKVIREEVSRLNRLVTQFLDFAYDPTDLQESLDLNEVVQTAIRNIQTSLAPSHQIQFQAHENPVIIKAVPDHLQQILLNLIQNAIKAVEGAENAEIRIRVYDTGFEVRDSGIGMSEEVRRKIFQPFFTSFKNGTGLGLSICQKLAHFNGGKITAISQTGVGTVMSVVFSHMKEGSHAR